MKAREKEGLVKKGSQNFIKNVMFLQQMMLKSPEGMLHARMEFINEIKRRALIILRLA